MAVKLGEGWGATCKEAVRGCLDALLPGDPLRCSGLDVTGTYAHAFEKSSATGGAIAVAIGPASISLNRSEERRSTSSGDLILAARYEAKEPVPTITEPEQASG